MGQSFSIQRGATRVVFAAGASARIAEELDRLATRRVTVVCTPGRKTAGEELAARLGTRAAGVVAIARQHVPAEIVDEARRAVAKAGADAVLALGGGSAIGLAKAVALDADVRVIAVPTTYSGSEMTPIYGITAGAEKRTGRDERVRPALVVYDPALTADLPAGLTITSLWNAMAHAVEALWAGGADRAARLSAEEALRLLAGAALRLAGGRDDDAGAAREAALEGAYLAGAVFADAGSGLHHTLCHVLGGMFDLPHAATHTVLLPHVVRFQREAAPDAMAAIARALGVIDPVLGIERLAVATGAPRSLEALGMPPGGIARAVDAALAVPALAGIDRARLTAMLERAWAAPPAEVDAPAVRAPAELDHLSGLGSTHESEALAGALPRRQNMPRPMPYGLHIECVNGTPFTTRSAENSRVWMYRVRPSFAHGEQVALPTARFAAELGPVEPNRRRWQPLPIPTAPTDFVDGLVTLGGCGEPLGGPGWAVHLYAANRDMADRSLSDADGDLLIVPQEGRLDCRTELGWLSAAPGTVVLIPRAMKLAIGLPDGAARGFVLEVYGRRLRLPERGPIGSNGLADARHFLAPVASYEDRACPDGFQIVHKLGGNVFAARQDHSPFDVVAWHGNHVPYSYDLSLFNAMGSVTWDHPDPSILTVLTAPLDDHGRAIADLVVFPPRWEVAEHSFRPPYMHRNAASEVSMVIRNPPGGAYQAGQVFLSPLLTAHGVTTTAYQHELGVPAGVDEPPARGSDDSLWVMFESALPFRTTAWARRTPLLDAGFADLFAGTPAPFDPDRR
jgi:homogentisate 1,2-dioxygenase